jgi:hypothetical protein
MILGSHRALALSFLRLLSLVVFTLLMVLFHPGSMPSLVLLTMVAMHNVGLLSRSFFRGSDIKLSHQLRILMLVSVGTHSESGMTRIKTNNCGTMVGVHWQVHWISWRFAQLELWTPDSHQTTVLHGKHNVLTRMSSVRIMITAF